MTAPGQSSHGTSARCGAPSPPEHGRGYGCILDAGHDGDHRAFPDKTTEIAWSAGSQEPAPALNPGCTCGHPYSDHLPSDEGCFKCECERYAGPDPNPAPDGLVWTIRHEQGPQAAVVEIKGPQTGWRDVVPKEMREALDALTHAADPFFTHADKPEMFEDGVQLMALGIALNGAWAALSAGVTGTGDETDG